MQSFPAIDLRQGRCVRLSQGRFEQETRYSDEPLAVARSFARQGAQWLHLVDLDGARDPARRQVPLLAELVNESGLRVQIGGGLRDAGQIADLLAVGCERVLIGSMAVTTPETVKEWLRRFGAVRIALALDVQVDAKGSARLATNGWQSTSDVDVFDRIREFLPFGLRTVLCTDIGCDGLLQGPNRNLYASLRRAFPSLELIASGGIASVADVATLRSLGMNGAIVGKALYENRFTLADVLERPGACA